MFKGYKLQSGIEHYISQNYEDYLSIGKIDYNKKKEEIQTDLENFYLDDNTIDGKSLKEKWFPNVKADVFLSHSHADETDTIAFAGFLKKHFDLECFIDSTVWGYSYNLLKQIDEKYCKHSNGQSYDYDKRNYSTSHVYMMLNMALLEMLDLTECVIFVDTPSSIERAKKTINLGTYSPWIYTELNMTKFIRINPPQRWYRELATENKEIQFKAFNQSLSIIYDVESPLDNLIELNFNHLNILLQTRMHNSKHSSTPIAHQNLDRLYKVAKKELNYEKSK